MRLKINFQKVFKAITAAGGFAQALETQDLEGKVTNVGRLLNEKKKDKKKDDDEDDDKKKS